MDIQAEATQRFRHLLKEIEIQFGKRQAKLCHLLFHATPKKQRWDVCLFDGRVFEDALIGCDFFYAWHFEATVETLFDMLTRIKVIGDVSKPVECVRLEEILDLVAMPKEKISEADFSRIKLDDVLAQTNESGQSFEQYIRSTYQPQSEKSFSRYATRAWLAYQKTRGDNDNA